VRRNWVKEEEGGREVERGHKHPPSLLLLVIVAIGVHPAGARLPPIRNLFTQALGLQCLSLVLSFYEWSSKLAVRVTSGQAALTTDQVVVIETRDLAALTPAQVSALRSSQLEALTTSVRVERLLEAGSAAAMETAQVASFTSGQVAVYFTRHLIG